MSLSCSIRATSWLFGQIAAFHLPRNDQVNLIRRLGSWVRDGGVVLATVSLTDEAPYTERDFFGVTMYWTNFAQATYEAMFAKAGFRVIDQGVIGHGYSDVDAPEERHPFLFLERVPNA